MKIYIYFLLFGFVIFNGQGKSLFRKGRVNIVKYADVEETDTATISETVIEEMGNSTEDSMTPPHFNDFENIGNSIIKTTPNYNDEAVPPLHPFECSKGKNCSYDIIEKHLLPVFFNLQEQMPTIKPPQIIACQDSSEDFPLFFTDQQREKGAVAVSFLVGVYCFTLLAIICDNYFLPCVERICESFNLSQDVAAATFMSIATSAPELFVNLIGTFVTESDIGIGTVVGSSMFNTLGVASLGGLFASAPIKMDWYPVTRDIIMYISSVILLVIITWDGKVRLHEGLILFIVYFIYFIAMFQNDRISKRIKSWLNLSDTSENKGILTSKSSSFSLNTTASTISQDSSISFIEVSSIKSLTKKDDNKDSIKSNEEFIKTKTWYKWVYDIFTAPIRLVLFCTVPDPQKYPKLFPLTFIMCILWIGSNSYLVSWQITVIGQTFGINDAVLGLTFLAAGGCLPEAISISIMSRKGEGSMGISNALGANTMNILLSLGMPWLIKILILGSDDNAFIRIDSGSIEYTILALIVVAISLYITLVLNKFHLSRITGGILLAIYLVFIVLAVLSEMVFFKSTRPDCN